MGRGEGSVGCDKCVVVKGVLNFALNDIDETGEKGGEGFDGDGSFTRVEGFPFVRNSREEGGGVTCSVCGLDVGIFDREEVEVVGRAPLFCEFRQKSYCPTYSLVTRTP